MPELVADCPRCGARKITFDVRGIQHVSTSHGWKRWFETFCTCRHCNRSAIFVLGQSEIEPKPLYANYKAIMELNGSLNPYFRVEHYVSLKDEASVAPPDYVPDPIKAAFTEAATCLAVECWNAAGAMFRLCIDLATRPMLPADDVAGLNSHVRRNLGLRLRWMLDNAKLPPDLRDLSTCVREDGNDAAHLGSLTKDDADDLLDFTTALLERLYTEPEQLKLAKDRREKRRSKGEGGG